MEVAQVLPLALPVLLIQLPLLPLVVQPDSQLDGLIKDAMSIMPMGVYLMYKNQTPRHLLLNPALQLVWPPGTKLQVWSTVLSASVVIVLLMAAFSRTPIQIATLPALATTKNNAVAATECPSMLEGLWPSHHHPLRKRPVYPALGPTKDVLRE